MTRGRAVVAAALLLGTVLLGTLVGPAGAHTEIRESSPGPDAVVGGRVGEIQLAFWSRLLPTGPNEISVAGPDGEAVANAGEPRLGASILAQPIVPLVVEGTYQVRYLVTAEDGEVVQSQYSFTFDKEAAAPTAVVGAETLPSAKGGGSPIGSVAAFGAMGVFAVAVLWIVFGRRRSAASRPSNQPSKSSKSSKSAPRSTPVRPARDTQSQRKRR